MTPQQQKFMELSLETSKNTLTALTLANEQGAIADTIWLSKYETLFDYLESQIDAMQRILAQPEQEPVAYGMWDTMLGYGGRMMMVRLDKGQDGCTVPLYTAPAHQNVNVDDIGVPVGVGGWLTTTSSQPEQEPVAWKLVPIKPTEEMLKAMDECSTEGYDERLYAGHAASVYMAAVDVAPTPPQRKPLTNEEITQAFNKAMAERPKDASNAETNRLFVRAIEAAHGIKE